MRTNGKIHIIFGLLLLLLLPVGLWGEEVAPRSLSASSEAAGELVSPVVAVDSFQAELPISPPPTPSPQAGRGSSNASQVASVVRLPTSRDNTSDRTSLTVRFNIELFRPVPTSPDLIGINLNKSRLAFFLKN